MFCDTCNEFSKENFEKHLKTNSHLSKTGERVNCYLCGLNDTKYFYQLYLKSSKHLVKTGEKKVPFVKKFMILINR